MESITYVCYNQDDLAAQMKTYMTEIQNMKAALVKVAENDVDAGVLEEVKALLGMSESTTAAPSTSDAAAPETKETTTEPSATADSSTDTKSEDTTDSEPSTTSTEPSTEPHTVTVQPGDTLQTLAEKTGATPRHLIDLNMLMEPVVLRPGQALKY